MRTTLVCPKKHKLFLAAYRNSKTIKRICDMWYCPICGLFFKLEAAKLDGIVILAEQQRIKND